MTLKEGRLLVPDWLARVLLKLIIYLHYSTHKERSPLKNLQWAAVLCHVDPRGSNVNGQSALSWSGAHLLQPRYEETHHHAEPQGRWSAAAECCQLRIGNWGYNCCRFTKLDNHRMENHHLFWVSVSAVTSSSNSNITNGKFIADAAVADHTAGFAFFLQYFVDVEKCVGEKGFSVTLVTSTR